MAKPLTLSARMYQIKPRMSTGGKTIAEVSRGQFRSFGADQAVFGGIFATCVTWPIFRPGRGVPLP
jgi:hypothetical protein